MDVGDTPKDESELNAKPVDETTDTKESVPTTSQVSLENDIAAIESDTTVVAPESQSTPPAPSPVATHLVDAASQKQGSSAGIIILQWLTYAFWGWTILSLVWLIYIVIASITTDNDTSDMVPYAIAAVLVLLPISLICDIFYGKREPVKKTGASMVVMVIHAVIFALFGIGMLITGVLMVVQLSIGTSSDTDFQTVWIITAFISAVIYAFTFLRTLNPLPSLHLAKIFPIVMAVVVSVFIVGGFVGPVAQANLTKDDRIITGSIDQVSDSIQSYVTDNEKLPGSLADVTFTGDAKSAVDKGLFDYKPGKIIPEGVSDADGDGITTMEYKVSTEYQYELCVDYKKADSNGRSYGSYQNMNDYQSSPYTYGHAAGNVCYKLKAVTQN